MTRQVDAIPASSRSILRACRLGGRAVASRRARQHLEAALECEPQNACAPAAAGDLEKSPAVWSARSSTGKRIESQNPAYLALAAQRLFEAHRETGRAEEGCAARRLSGALPVALRPARRRVQQTLEARGHEEPTSSARRAAQKSDAAPPRSPARGADHRRRLPDKRRDLELVRSLVHGHTRRLGALPLRNLRLQGAPVLLALSRLRAAGRPTRREEPRNSSSPMNRLA